MQNGKEAIFKCCEQYMQVTMRYLWFVIKLQLVLQATANVAKCSGCANSSFSGHLRVILLQVTVILFFLPFPI